MRRGPVDNDGEDVAAFFLECFSGKLARFYNPFHRSLVCVGDQQNRTSQVVGNLHIQIKFKGRRFAFIVCPEAKNKIIFILKFLVFVEDTFQEFVVFFLGDQVSRFLKGIGVQMAIRNIEVIVGLNEMQNFIDTVLILPDIDDRPEKRYKAV